MPIYQTARYQVKPQSRVLCEQAVREFVAYVTQHEQGTTLYYWSWQQPDDPTRFLNVFAFADEAAREKHRTSEGVMRFTSILYPELIRDVEFTEYTLLAST
jgi:quinol monooxygenase YgiN